MAKGKNPIFLLSTTDNPYSPFDEYSKWYYEDVRLGYNTCGLIARLTQASDVFNDDSDLLTMRNIIELGINENYILVVREDFEPKSET